MFSPEDCNRRKISVVVQFQKQFHAKAQRRKEGAKKAFKKD
jgi:hypothetical protein